ERKNAAFNIVQAFLDQFVEFVGNASYNGLAFQILNGGYVRYSAVPAGFSQQRYIVAGALVFIRTAQIKDAGIFNFGISRVGKICLRSYHFYVIEVKIPIAEIINNYNFAHLRRK